MENQTYSMPILPWIGGKRRLAKLILPLFPSHECYVEPFAGGASLFFMKHPSDVEVINDINGDLINLYRVVKHHLEEFVRQFKDAYTQSYLTASVLASVLASGVSGWTTPFRCQSQSGVIASLPHTAAQIQQVGEDVKTYVQTQIIKGDTLIAAINSVNDSPAAIATVQGVAW